MASNDQAYHTYRSGKPYNKVRAETYDGHDIFLNEFGDYETEIEGKLDRAGSVARLRKRIRSLRKSIKVHIVQRGVVVPASPREGLVSGFKDGYPMNEQGHKFNAGWNAQLYHFAPEIVANLNDILAAIDELRVEYAAEVAKLRMVTPGNFDGGERAKPDDPQAGWENVQHGRTDRTDADHRHADRPCGTDTTYPRRYADGLFDQAVQP